MVFFLVVDVRNDITYLGPRIREYTISILPAEFLTHPVFVVDEFVAFYLNLLDEVRNQDRRIKSDEQVDMIGHTVNGEHFCFSVLDKTGNVFMKFLFVCSFDEALTVFDSKDEMKINLRICICHNK